MNIEH